MVLFATTFSFAERLCGHIRSELRDKFPDLFKAYHTRSTSLAVKSVARLNC